MPQDVFANAAKSVVDLCVGIAQDVQPERMQICVSFTVSFDALRLKMLRSVQLDHESGRMTIEVDDIGADDLLTVKGTGSGLEKIVPEMTLLFCHAASKCTRVFRKNRIAERHDPTSSAGRFPSSVSLALDSFPRGKPEKNGGLKAFPWGKVARSAG